MSVDVVIPTFQETERLFRAVDSVLSQSSPVNNIYVLDDGSSQDVTRVLGKHLGKERRVHVVLMDHTGLPGVGRARGINLSSADWIAFLDADDLWASTKIEEQLLLAETSGSNLVCTNARIMKDGLEQRDYFPVGSVPDSLSFRELIKDNKVIASSVLASRTLLLKVGVYATGHQVRAVEDYATWLRCSSLEKISYLDSTLVDYELSESGLSAKSDPNVSIFAISDFIVWSRTTPSLGMGIAKKLRRVAHKEIKRRFL
jgi:glycosyltransferase involved in cell wall biosynthesis